MKGNTIRRRAVLVGCNYVSTPTISLNGPSNDVALIAACLVHLCHFDPREVCVLADAAPSEALLVSDDQETEQLTVGSRPDTGNYIFGLRNKIFGDGNSKQNEYPLLRNLDIPVDQESSPIVAAHSRAHSWPTKEHILKALMWLVKDSKPGDQLVFYFSGHSVQVDDLSGWEGEGYDDALIPCDFSDKLAGGSWQVLPAITLRQMLFGGLPFGVEITIILDTCGCQMTVGTLGPMTGLPSCSSKNTGSSIPLNGLSYGFISGLKTRGIDILTISKYLPWRFPFLSNPTKKMHRSTFNAKVWQNEELANQLVRPKYLPAIDLDSTETQSHPYLRPLGELPINAFGVCIAAAPWGTTAVEATFPSIKIKTRASMGEIVSSFRSGVPVTHGIFTYSFVLAMMEASDGINPLSTSLQKLVNRTNQNIDRLRSKRFKYLDQRIELTPYSTVARYQGGLTDTNSKHKIARLSYHQMIQPYLNLREAWASTVGNSPTKFYSSGCSFNGMLVYQDHEPGDEL